MLRQLVHKGVVVPTPPGPYNLILTVRGRQVALTPEQEEMALAWARKLGTPYVEDPVFVRNFLADFSAALGIEPPLKLHEVDFQPAEAIILHDRAQREQMTKEERKALAAERKVAREAMKAEYGRAIVDGEETDLGTYLVEPSSIFMGRGQHPLRGRWKEGPKQHDITLNLSPDAPRPAGNWAGIVWQPESMWIARWQDKLSGKVKYIWLADTATVKQNREAHKFDKATDLDANIDAVRAHIRAALTSEDARRRQVATACYLIDTLCLRVGDEKDPDEADTVGATTLRPEHVILHEDGTAEFKFLGKDSVLWHKKIELPEEVRRNLVELGRNARPGRNSAHDKPQLFADVSSRDVNAFLSEALPGLSAKVFRTHHATVVVRDTLDEAGVSASDPDYKKRAAAAEANLAAAVLCNHYKTAPARWAERRAKAQERKKQLQARVQELKAPLEEAREALKAARAAAKEKEEAAKTPAQREKAKASGRKKIEAAERKVEQAQARLRRAEEALARFSSQATLASKTRTWNLGTSLKSYIDPRIYQRWGERVGYDVIAAYYPKTLQRKFAWVKNGNEAEDEESEAIAESMES